VFTLLLISIKEGFVLHYPFFMPKAFKIDMIKLISYQGRSGELSYYIFPQSFRSIIDAISECFSNLFQQHFLISLYSF
jgi:hypothetical protein